MYEGSLRMSRPQSIHSNFRPPVSPKRTWPVSYIASATTDKHISETLNLIDEDEQLFREPRQEIRQIKVQDVDSTRNALQLAYQAFQIGTSTLDTLNEQSSRVYSAERALDQTGIESATATRKIKELKPNNLLMNLFNPFSSVKCELKENADVIAVRQQHSQDRDAVRLDAWHKWKLREKRLFVSVPLSPTATRRDLEARAKYQLEPDNRSRLDRIH